MKINSKLLLAVISLLCLVGCGKKEKTISNYTFMTDVFTSTGEYTGSVYKGMPSGKGNFISDENIAKPFECSGIWQYGKLNGYGYIKYQDGTCYTGNFVDNVLNDEITVTKEDGSYYRCSYDKGTPFGTIFYYDAEGSLIKRDWYYEGTAIKELVDIAEKVEYDNLLKDVYSHVNSVIGIKGMVVAVEQDNKSVSFTIHDKNDNEYVMMYDNTELDKNRQGIIPLFSEGEEITAYGIYLGVGNDRTPKIRGIYAFSVGDVTKDNLITSFNYKDICRNPFYYLHEKVSKKGKVVSSVYSKQHYYSKFVTGSNEIYYIMSNEKPDSEEEIIISGKYYGSYKEPAGLEYMNYPLISVENE